MTSERERIYSVLRERFADNPFNGRWTGVECPYCGARKVRQRQAGFDNRVFHCFRCGATVQIEKFARDIGVTEGDRQTRAPKRRRARTYAWKKDPERYLRATLRRPDEALRRWREYSPLITPQMIERYSLGIGVVPSTHCRHDRLTYPFVNDEGIIVLRGRRLDCDCEGKWIGAGGGGRGLWGKERLCEGADVVLCESPIDAMLLMEADNSLVAIAPTTGAGSWASVWTEYLLEHKPRHILVAYDNDLAGQARGETRARLLRAWEEKHPLALARPISGGFKVYNILAEAGLNVSLFDWGDAPAGADIRWLLEYGGTIAE